ncbi:BnaC03g27030D [Brassica napus]|uniref:BnaC03g27030D protein n=1 Tax=Brassica napus TaxID=3708 RepID=A0A078G7V6_BRANA|nr:BnaC03g27030D [Brassica napus]
MMFQVSDVGHRDVETPSSNNGQDSIGSMNKKHPYARPEAGFSSNHGDNQDNDELPRKRNYPETEKGSSSRHSCIVADVTTASSLHTYTPVFLTQDFTSLGGLKGKGSPKRIISSMGTRFVTFTLAPVDVRHCRLRLPMQFSRENGINKPGKIYLLGNDGSKWLANLLQESRGRMTVGDGWKSFVKANGLKIGESYTLELNWEDTTPVLSLCPTDHHSVGIRADGECSEASENESLPIKPSSGTEVIKYDNRKDESSSWEREKNHLRSRDSSSASQNRFLTLTITPDSLRHGRLRLPLEFMTENSMNRPGDITLLGKDGAKWLASLLLERRGRMCLGKGWKDFAKANGLKTGDSITLESIWEDSTPVLRLLHIESTDDRRQQDECSKAREKESAFTEPSSGNKTRKLESNREESRIYPLTRLDSSLVNQNRFETSTVRYGAHDYQIGEIVVFRDERDMMFQVSDLGPRFSEIQNVLAPSSNSDQENIGSISIIRKETGFSLYDGDDQYNIELPRKKKAKKNNPGTEADSSPERSCFVAHVTASNLHTDAPHLPQDFTSSNSPTQIVSSYLSSEKQLATFTLAPVDVRNCRLRLPMQFTRENGINKPGKIYLLGKDGSKWLANLLLESRGRMTLGDGWKSFVKANGLKTGESFTLKLNWEDATPVLSLCPPECSIDSREGGECSETIEKEPLPIVLSCEKEISKDDENRKKESSSWERETNLLIWRDSTVLSQNRCLTLTITPDSLKHGRLRLPLEFMTDNSMNKPGEITLLGKDGVKWLVSLLLEKRGRMSLGKGSGNKTRKAENRREGSSSWELEKRRYSSSAFQNRIVILTLTPEGVRDCKLQLPSQFMRTNGIMNPGKITLLGRSGMKWFAYLLSKDGTIALENGWKGFCEANGVMVGESFVLELIPTEDADHVFKFYSNYGYHIHKCSFLAMSFNLLYLMSHMRFTKFLIEANAETADTQGHATDFVARFFSHAGLMSFISISRRSVPSTIPSDFFSNYIKDLETTTAELKSDSSLDITWKVKLTGRILNDGWGDFAVANSLQIGNVVLVRYEGGTVFHVSDLGPSFSQIRDIKPPKQNIDDDDEVPLNKKVKTNIYETEADSCLKAFLTDSSLHTDTLHFTSSNALSRNCSEAHSAQLSNEDMEREREEDESLIKKKLKPKQRPVSYSSYSPCHKRFVTFTLPPEYSTLCRLTLPNLFVKENGISTPAEICVLGKDGTKWPITLLLDKKGIMSFGKGWKEFVKANGLETGFTLKLMWEDTTPSFSLCCPESASDKDEEECLESIKKQSLSIDRRIRDKPGKRKNNKEEKKSWEREKIHLRGRDVGDFEEVPINKKVKTDSHGTDAASSSLDNSCFVAFVTDSSLDTDTLYLPRYFTSSNGLTRKCLKIVLIDGGGRSWAMDLSFNESSDIFYISPGWRSFCDKNGLEAGGFFTFKLVGNEETPVLSFCPMVSIDSRSQKDCFEAHSTEVSNEEEEIERERNEEETLMDIEEKKKSKPEQRPVSYSSYSPCYKRFITFTLPPDYATLDKLTLPKLFVKENGINKPGEIYLLGKDGTKWLTRLLLDKKGLMRLGKGWKDFVKANGVESGFTLKLIWEDATPSFSLCCAESTSDKDEEEYLETIKKQSLSIDRRIRDKISKVENDKEEKRSWEREKIDMRGRDSTTSSQKQFLTLAITPTSLRCNRMRLPIPFLRKSCMDKPGVIYLLGKDDTKWMANLIQEGDGRMKLGKGWTAFAKENEFKAGESVTLESIWEDETPMIRFLRTESESSKANKKESIYTEDTESRTRDSSTEIHARFVTLTLKHEDVKACMLILPSQFLKANGINKLGKITLLDENEVELSAYLLSREGIVAVESGWGEFCEANGVKLGESFTLECIKEQDETAPVLKVMFSGG